MKTKEKTNNFLENCEFLIVSVIFSFISFITGLIILFYKFKFETLTYTISIFFMLLILSSIVQISYEKNINIKFILGKITYYIICFILFILSFFIYYAEFTF